MKALNIITLLLIIIGGLNWGLIGLADINLVAVLFGTGPLAMVTYLLVGASAVYQLVPFSQSLAVGEVRAQANLDHGRDAVVTRDTTIRDTNSRI